MKQSSTSSFELARTFPSQVDNYRHLVIEAGAGAGKTHLICQRVEYLLFHAPAHILMRPDQLCITTFSRAADQELKERIRRQLLQYSNTIPDLISISTIDSLFFDLFQNAYTQWRENIAEHTTRLLPKIEEPQNLQEIPTPKLISTEQAICDFEKPFNEFILKHTQEFPTEGLDCLLAGGLWQGFRDYGNTTDSILNALLSESFLRIDAPPIIIASQKVHPFILKLLPLLKTLAQHQFYIRLLKGMVTFNDVTMFIYNLFCADQNYQKNTYFEQQFKPMFLWEPQELIVDEYQDTSNTQHAILFFLTNGKNKNNRMVVVGDPKQSIYGFRNAHVSVFNGLKQSPDWLHIELTSNYRSHPNLLPFINELSRETFNFHDPKIPQDFLQSSLYKNTLQFFVSSKDLVSARHTQSEQLQKKPVLSILGASLNKERSTDTNLEKIKLSEFQCWAISKHVQNLLKIYESQKIAVLCETNKRAIQIKKMLQNFDIQSKHFTKKKIATHSKSILPLYTGLQLAKCLDGSATKQDIFLFLSSPLLQWNYRKYLKDSDKWFAYLKKYQEMAKKHFFSAWQYMRWDLAHGQNFEQLDFDCDGAAYHAMQMEPFAIALLKFTEDNPLASPLPASLDAWNLNPPVDPAEDENGIQIMTVHGAKGLEWDAVIFCPESFAQRSESDFFMVDGETVNYLRWLPEDRNNMSYLEWLTNHDYTQSYVTIKDKKQWIADWQKRSLNHFERQRVFYTAFTRAREHLTICFPFASGNTQKSLRDTIATCSDTENDLLKKCKIEKLHDAVISKVTDHYFKLRKPSDKKTPPHPPWQGENIEGVLREDKQKELVSFYEYGPDWGAEYLAFENKIKNKTSTENLDKNRDNINKNKLLQDLHNCVPWRLSARYPTLNLTQHKANPLFEIFLQNALKIHKNIEIWGQLPAHLKTKKNMLTRIPQGNQLEAPVKRVVKQLLLIDAEQYQSTLLANQIDWPQDSKNRKQLLLNSPQTWIVWHHSSTAWQWREQLHLEELLHFCSLYLKKHNLLQSQEQTAFPPIVGVLQHPTHPTEDQYRLEIVYPLG